MKRIVQVVILSVEHVDMIKRMINSDIDRCIELKSTSCDDEEMLDLSKEIVRLEKLKEIIEF